MPHSTSLHILRLPHNRTLALDRPCLMGILNVTPDSFSDGGQWLQADAAVSHSLRMLEEGAQIIDVGGESTRPGSARVGADQQELRVLPVIESILLRKPEAILSIDTTLTAVAEAALDAGASIINDISAGRDDPGMFTLAARRGAPIILMHMQGAPATMQNHPSYGDVLAEVEAFLMDRAAEAQHAGVPREQIILDPGIGFGKTKEHNLKLLAHLERLAAKGYPLMLGSSRKRFMGAVCQRPDGQPPQPKDLLGATCATTALGVAAGVHIFRVHDVQANRQAADVAWAIRQSR